MMVSTNPMHQFVIERFAQINVGGFDLSITNSTVFMVLGILLVIGGLAWAISSPSTVPSRKQSVAEVTYGFVAGIIRDINGPEGMKYFPLVFSLFSFILIANLLGMFPYFFTTTSHVAVTFALALLVIAIVVVLGFAHNGLGFFKIFAPSGVPPVLYLLVTPIEIISFLSRPLSLGMRLFANMLAGHMALKIFAGFVPMMVAGLGALGAVGAAVAVMPMVVGMTALEFLVAFLQAYVFALLTCVYLNDALHGGH